MKLSEACEAYLSDMQARHLRDFNPGKRCKSLFRAWQTYADERELDRISPISISPRCAPGASPGICKPGTQRLRLKPITRILHPCRSILDGFGCHHRWQNLKAPRATDQPTMPLSRHEIVSLVTAATASVNMPKERALISAHALLRSLDLRCRHPSPGGHRLSQQPYVAASQERRACHGSTAQPSDRGP